MKIVKKSGTSTTTLYLTVIFCDLPKLGQPRPNSVNIRRGWAVCNSSQEPWLLEARVFKESLTPGDCCHLCWCRGRAAAEGPSAACPAPARAGTVVFYQGSSTIHCIIHTYTSCGHWDWWTWTVEHSWSRVIVDFTTFSYRQYAAKRGFG